MTLSHLTLNTGHLRMSPRAEVAEATIRYLDPLARAGFGWVPGMDASLEIGFRLAGRGEARLIEFFCRPSGGKRGSESAIAACTMAWSDEETEWAAQSLGRIATKAGIPVAALPHFSSPCLLVLLRPASAALPPDVMMALGDFERCLAWTILAREGLAS